MRRLVPLVALLLLAACTQSSQTRVALTRAAVAPTPITEVPSTVVTAPPAAAASPAPVSTDDGSASTGEDIDTQPRTTRRCDSVAESAGPFNVAEAVGNAMPVYRSPGDAAPFKSFSNPNQYGVPRVMLVSNQQGDWLEVMLPQRPNGSRGWVKTSDVSLVQHNYRLVVQQGAHLITAWNGGQQILQEPIGLGRAGTATPCGEYYISDLLRPTNPNGPYGPYAFGLSGYSDVLYSFAGGPGQIGLHGTNQPGGLGRNVSHGCIRMSNEGITRLAQILPLGTPVFISG